MRFKSWFENLSGPGNGGTMYPAVGDAERFASLGAMPRYNKSDDPPVNGPKSPDADYYPLTRKMSKMTRKMSKKRMKKG